MAIVGQLSIQKRQQIFAEAHVASMRHLMFARLFYLLLGGISRDIFVIPPCPRFLYEQLLQTNIPGQRHVDVDSYLPSVLVI